MAGPAGFLSVLPMACCGVGWFLSFLRASVGGQGCLLNFPGCVQSLFPDVVVASDAYLKERSKEDP